IILYITLRFQFKFAIAAILALMNDILIAVGGIALLGYEINTPFIAAVLTILGYSINDTIVVFDRIRETLKRKSDSNFGELLDKSINQVVTRSINTSVTTLLAIIAILVFGGDSLRTFITTLLIGTIAGTYSSIFIATPLVYLLEKNRDGKVDTSKYLEKEESKNNEKIVV
ncbi:MAG: protein translocase subunit SecF, partial [Fusobacterium sp.]